VEAVAFSRLKKHAAVGKKRERFVRRSAVNQPTEREDARPCAKAVRKSLAARAAGSAIEFREQPREAVGLVIDGVTAREEVARLSKKREDEPHDDAARGDVGVRRQRRIFETIEKRAVALDKLLHGHADALAENRREFRLPFARIPDAA